MNTVGKFLVAAIAASSLAAHAARSNLSDLWYSPTDAGLTANVVQQDDAAVVTLSVADAGGEIRWYVAPNATMFAISASGLPYFRGTLYRARADWLGGSTDSAPSQMNAIGEIYLSPRSSGSIDVEYTIDGATSLKTFARKTWSLPYIDMSYLANFSVVQTGSDGKITRPTFSGTTTLWIEEGVATMNVYGVDGRCTYTGPYGQDGRIGGFAGTYSCTNARSGTFRVEELEFTANGFSGKINASWDGGQFRGAFGGPRR